MAKSATKRGSAPKPKGFRGGVKRPARKSKAKPSGRSRPALAADGQKLTPAGEQALHDVALYLRGGQGLSLYGF